METKATRPFSDDEIVNKALTRTEELDQKESSTGEIAVDLQDADGLTHSYAVSFRKNSSGFWEKTDITEISSL
jgi:hypothetical protein